ncbi:hypothetical protein C5167_042386 [Papaver somniferum]|uniref:1,4-dihydroxy-2-naphthoyl-CoA synthase n=1 Tax=Papaver somniferum TaxID=3469 RepID=A0A4Y7L4D2_PAPSO|nr:hypothetical protein C5167_042386 [Papaver somniferum]
MAVISGKGMKNVERRIGFVANHIIPSTNGSNSVSYSSMKMNNTSMNDSYHRVHGEVPTHEVFRRTACDDLGIQFTDIIYENLWFTLNFITISRPERRNAFRPQTVKELMRAFNDARDDSTIGVIIFTGKDTTEYGGPLLNTEVQHSVGVIQPNTKSVSDGCRVPQAFCSGGDQALRGKDGYADYDNFGRLNVLDLQVQIRRLPKPVIAMVAGYAVGGGHVLHMVCDLTIAADNAVFGQTCPKVGSLDAGYGRLWFVRCGVWNNVAHVDDHKLSKADKGENIKRNSKHSPYKKARFYDASEAEKMGLVNTVVPKALKRAPYTLLQWKLSLTGDFLFVKQLAKLEQETVKWCREIMRNSPTAIRVIKSALNAVDDGHAGLQELAGDATLLFYGTEEGNEGKTAYIQQRPPNFAKFPRRP